MEKHSVRFNNKNISYDIVLTRDICNSLFEGYDYTYEKGFDNLTRTIICPIKKRFIFLEIKSHTFNKLNYEYIIDDTIDDIFVSDCKVLDSSQNILKYDILNHVMSFIDNSNNIIITSFQKKILGMIEQCDNKVKDNILSNLSHQQFEYNDESNPIKTLIDTIFIEPNIVGNDNDDIDNLFYARNMFMKYEIKNEIDNHMFNILPFVFYFRNDQQKYCGPLFLSEDTCKRFHENCESYNIDSYPNYEFYVSTNFEHKDNIDDQLWQNEYGELWKGDFEPYSKIIIPFPFQIKDKINMKLTYDFLHLNDKLNVNIPNLEYKLTFELIA
jgi:hypothetical protein